MRENINYTGLMKRKANDDADEVAHRVEELLSILGLTEVVSARGIAARVCVIPLFCVRLSALVKSSSFSRLLSSRRMLAPRA